MKTEIRRSTLLYVPFFFRKKRKFFYEIESYTEKNPHVIMDELGGCF